MNPFELTAGEFLSDVSSTTALWNSLDVRVLAFRVDNAWHNAYTRCLLRREAPDQVMRLPLTVSTERVLCVQQVFALDTISELLGMVAHGELNVADISIKYVDRSRHEDAHPYSSNYTCLPGGSDARAGFAGMHRLPVRDGWPALYFSATGSTYHELLRDVPGGVGNLDAEVNALQGPLDGTEGITELLLGAPHPRANELKGRFEVIGSLPYLLDPLGCRLHNDVLEVRVRAGGASARACGTVAYAITRGADVLTTGAIQLSDASWSQNGPDWVGTARVPAVAGAAATLLLRVGARTIMRHRLGNFESNPTNPRIQALAAADPDLALLQKALQTAGGLNSKDSKGFERAVARLFAVLGFQVLGLGPEGEMSDALDVIAFDPQGTSVLAIECTAEAIDSGGKLGKLHYRAGKLQDLLPGMDVQSIVITAGQRALLAAAELEQAGHDRTVVLGSEQSQELLAMASEGRSIAEILSYLAQLIPPRAERSGAYFPALGGLNRWR